MPINLHLEQYVVENSNGGEKSCYDFTTVGAFTVFHTHKNNNVKPVEVLMMRDKPFEFNNNNAGGPQDLIENEIVLNFYSIRVFIQISHDLVTLADKNLDKSQVSALRNPFFW